MMANIGLIREIFEILSGNFRSYFIISCESFVHALPVFPQQYRRHDTFGLEIKKGKGGKLGWVMKVFVFISQADRQGTGSRRKIPVPSEIMRLAEKESRDRIHDDGQISSPLFGETRIFQNAKMQYR